MNHKIQYFAVLFIMMVVGVLSGRAKIVVPVWELEGEPYSQDGVTIARDYPNISITSSDKNIVMVGIKRVYQDNYYDDDPGEASNTFVFEGQNKKYSLKNMNNSVLNNSSNSDNWEYWLYSLQDYDGHTEHPILGYDVWKGNAKQLIFNVSLDLGDVIVIYQDTDVLPQKTLFAVIDTKEKLVNDVPYREEKTTIFYGYDDFLPEKFGMLGEGFAGYRYAKVEKYQFKTDGTKQSRIDANLIIFDESCNEFKPQSTSKWFKDVRFDRLLLDNLDLSEVTDMSYMFENCKGLSSYDAQGNPSIISIDISDISFQNHPNVTGMFSGAKVNNLYVSYNVELANDDIFDSLGYNTTCYLSV